MNNDMAIWLLSRHVCRHITSVTRMRIIWSTLSTDTERETLRARIGVHDHWQYIDPGENLGFGAASNLGANASTAPWICFLNPDTVVEDDVFRCLIEVAESRDAAVVGPAYGPAGWLEWHSGRFPGLVLESLSIAMLGRPVEALWMGLRRRLGGERPLPVDWILGACMMLPRQWFDRSGGFDESFFLYYEEMDLCRRIRDAGGHILLAPTCRLQHIGSVSGKRDYRAFTRRFFEGKLHYLYKHHRGFMGSLMRAIVWLQLQFQRLLWRLPPFSADPRATAKLSGVADVLASLRSGFPWEVR